MLTLCGGAAARPQAESLARGAHLVVGTPGRLQDHLARGSLDLSRPEHPGAGRSRPHGGYGFLRRHRRHRLALPGHAPDAAVLGHLPRQHPQAQRPLPAQPGGDQGRGPARCQPDRADLSTRWTKTKGWTRWPALLAHFRPVSTLAFCNTKVRSHDLVERLGAEGISAQALNGDLEQRERDEILIQFANQSCAVLVATDVAARGLDIQNLGAVINVDVTKDTEVHVHRIGRSGRGDQKGLALSLCSPEEMRWATLIEQYQGAPLKWGDLKSLRPKGRSAVARADGHLVHPGRQEGQAAARGPAGRA